jgi:pentatricopeptide repeat protein
VRVAQSVAPTVETYNAVMDGCRRGNQGERAVAFLEEMRRKKLPIDTRWVEPLVRGWVALVGALGLRLWCEFRSCVAGWRLWVLWYSGVV